MASVPYLKVLGEDDGQLDAANFPNLYYCVIKSSTNITMKNHKFKFTPTVPDAELDRMLALNCKLQYYATDDALPRLCNIES